MKTTNYRDTDVYTELPPVDYGQKPQESVQTSIDHAAIVGGAAVPNALMLSKEDLASLTHAAQTIPNRRKSGLEVITMNMNYLETLDIHEQAIEFAEYLSALASTEVTLKAFKLERRSEQMFHSDDTFAANSDATHVGGWRLSRELFTDRPGALDVSLQKDRERGYIPGHNIPGSQLVRIGYEDNPILIPESKVKGVRIQTADEKTFTLGHPDHVGVPARRRSVAKRMIRPSPRAVITLDFCGAHQGTMYQSSLTHAQLSSLQLT